MILTDPPIVLQEKQLILSRRNLLEGTKPSQIGPLMFPFERSKIQNEAAVFVMITDERNRSKMKISLGERDILMCWDESGTES